MCNKHCRITDEVVIIQERQRKTINKNNLLSTIDLTFSDKMMKTRPQKFVINKCLKLKMTKNKNKRLADDVQECQHWNE